MNHERTLLGALFAKPSEALTLDLVESDFEERENAEIYAAILALVAEDVKPDLITVSDKLGGLIAVIGEIIREGGEPKNIPHYVNAMKKRAKTVAAKNIIREFAESTGDIDDRISTAAQRLTELNAGKTKSNIDPTNMAAQSNDIIDRVYHMRRQGKTIGIPTGINRLDTKLGGYHRKDLIIVGARPKMGKTSFALSSMLSAARAGYTVGYISTEMSVEQNGTRLFANIAGIDSAKFRNGDLEDGDWPRIAAASSEVSQLPIYTLDVPTCRPSDIYRQCHAWKSAHGLDILFVDYLTRLKPDESNPRHDLEVGSITSGLKSIAKTFDIPVVTLAQVSRQIEARQEKRPMMCDLRDSGIIEQEADEVLFLYRPWVYEENAPEADAEIIVAANRHGETGTVSCAFYPWFARWTNKGMAA